LPSSRTALLSPYFLTTMSGHSTVQSPRPCLAFRSRTRIYIQRACQEWAYIFGCSSPTVNLDSDSCLEMASEVKKLLSECPSMDHEAIMAWQSMKKGLPDSCKCMELPLLTKVVENFGLGQVPIPSDYLSFVRSEARRLFRKGWAKGVYENRVLTCSPGLSGTVDSPRAHGGCQSDWQNEHASFLETCLGSDAVGLDPLLGAELMVVQSAGKPRPLTKFVGESLVLKPLHDSIYDRLRGCRWLSVGDVRAETLDRARFSESIGGVLTSGDYKSATDQLSLEVAEVILSEILRGAPEVPAHLKEYALRALRPSLFHEGLGLKGLRPSRGQMMGSYLSFPLLCLQNRFAFLYAMKEAGHSRSDSERIPCLINGDDILMQTSLKTSGIWMKTVSSLGLEVERTKTSVDERFGTLNSTLLRWSGGNLRVRPTLRFGRLRQAEFVNSLSVAFRDWLAGVKGNLRFRAGVVFFKRNLTLLRSTKLSLLELGFRGRLAHRLGVLFSMDSALLELSPPPIPVGHNCVPDSLCTIKLEEDCAPEVLLANDRETAAWKFSFKYRQWLDRAKILYFVRLSAINSRREPQPRLAEVRSWVTPSSSLPLFLESRPSRPRRRWIFDSLLMQRDEGPPPAYSDRIGVSLPFGGHDAIKTGKDSKDSWGVIDFGIHSASHV